MICFPVIEEMFIVHYSKSLFICGVNKRKVAYLYVDKRNTDTMKEVKHRRKVVLIVVVTEERAYQKAASHMS